MEEYIRKGFGTGTKIKLKVIGIFISSILLFNCSNKSQIDNKHIFLFKENRKINKQKNSKVFYELIGDSIFIRTSNPFWGENKFAYKILSKSEQAKIIGILKNLDFSNFKHKYTSVSHNIDYQYDLGILKSNKGSYKSTIYSDSFPDELRRIIYFFNEVSEEGLKNIELKEHSLSELKLNKLVSKNDTVKISSYVNYRIWKVLNKSSKLLVSDKFNAKYRVLFEYPFNYEGKRIENLRTDNLKEFYYELEGKSYSFGLDKPINIEE